ncbi:MAG: hypothetical protein MUO43_12825 [Desulfobacterales bacterium]|nr:hypothetical protein [Desulfobacterales bacterium]
MTDVIQGLPERLSKRMKEQSVDQWIVKFEELITDIPKVEKSEQELLGQAEIVRKYLGNKKFASTADRNSQFL